MGVEQTTKKCYSRRMAKEKAEKTERHKKTTTAPDDYFDRLAQSTESAANAQNWSDSDYSGQLAVDVYQTHKDIVIQAAIAGVKADNIDITVNNDMVTIKGIRHLEHEVPAENYLYQECYWGGFSRTVILPVEVDANGVVAKLKNGILRVSLPKIERPKAPPISVEEEDEN